MSQLSPSQALTVNEGYTFSRDIPIRLGIPVLQDNFDKAKQIQQHRPNVPTNPDRSCTYLLLRAHSDERFVQLNQTSSFPEVASQAARFGPTLREALARGG